jgi:hypothetical protein
MRPEKPWPALLLWSATSIFAGVAGLVMTGSPACATASLSSGIAATQLAQDDEPPPPDENEVPPQDVEKYIKVYKAMQQNRSLTVDQASQQQGLTVAQFRSLEDRIERNDALREHVRDSLKPKASPTP